ELGREPAPELGTMRGNGGAGARHAVLLTFACCGLALPTGRLADLLEVGTGPSGPSACTARDLSHLVGVASVLVMFATAIVDVSLVGQLLAALGEVVAHILQ